MEAVVAEGGSPKSHLNTSELSHPSYSVIENARGQLVGCTNEEVIWPNRPLHGKYSLEEELNVRKKSNRQNKTKEEKDNLPPLQCMSSTSILGPRINPNNDIFHIPTSVLCSPKTATRKDCTSYEDIALRSETSVTSMTDSNARAAGDTYGILGKCTRDDAVHRLGNRWNAVLFNEENNRLYLAVLLNDIKYVLSIKEISLGDGEPAWGISWFGRDPGMIFRNLKKMTHFYSFNPAAAFYELTMKTKEKR